ncbi:ABC transporter ATP-binding protein [Acerihabitans arboris]|uniref:ATP-binding cassette domain-containing protein n=1 Tax=Acerihabitans arboris TaxID=2691583 RepID=A0A845SFG1_9GAMM|nr:ABC transporter ATP-binding protein [Acerihabitans arboris]NDL61816.1 ATP-binding cassette domain-containing protein [Acerihabitans arboris]
MTYLALREIRKSWGNNQALDAVSFEAAAGDFVALLGPSGCGKTTLLRIIAGLELADSGTVHIRQADVTALPPSQRRLSMVFQSYALFPHLNVRENLLFGLRARGEDKRAFAARLADVAGLMELGPLLDRLPAQLSGGQQQRVALGRAVIANHQLCLMDEPLSNLDAKLRQSMRREIRALQRQLGLTMVYVTHDQTEAMSMADKIILLNHGRVVQHGAPGELYNHPADIFTAQFIGSPSMNIIPHPENNAAGISLGVRAEEIAVTPAGTGNIACRVAHYEYMGAYTLLIGALPGTAESITIKVAGMRHFCPGDIVGLSWPAAAEYRFSTLTGKRLPDQASHGRPGCGRRSRRGNGRSPGPGRGAALINPDL